MTTEYDRLLMHGVGELTVKTVLTTATKQFEESFTCSLINNTLLRQCEARGVGVVGDLPRKLVDNIISTKVEQSQPFGIIVCEIFRSLVEVYVKLEKQTMLDAAAVTTYSMMEYMKTRNYPISMPTPVYDSIIDRVTILQNTETKP